MNDVEKRAQTDLQDLNTYVQEAISLTDQLFHEVRYSDDDHLGFLILAFLSKLKEQATSVQLLVSSGNGRDGELVARSMLECMASLLWAAQAPDDRAFRWRGFAYVEDFRLSKRQQAEGIAVDPAIQQGTDNFLKKHGSIFEDPNRRGKVDPYYPNWRCGVQIGKIFQDVGIAVLYREIYGPFSDWIHSGTKSLGAAISRQGNSIQWNPPAPTVDATDLAVAFQSLVEALKLGAEHFTSPIESQMDDLVDRFTTRFQCGATSE